MPKDQDHFSSAALTYEREALLQSDLARRLVEAASSQPENSLKKQAPKRILDAASGTGFVLLQAFARFPDAECTALDKSQAMLERAREALSSVKSKQNAPGAPGARFLRADLRLLPFESESFDLVFCNAAYHWLLLGETEKSTKDVLAPAFAEARRVLKSGGLFAATIYAKGTLREFQENSKHRALFLPFPTAGKVRGAIQESGLELTSLKTTRSTSYYEKPSGVFETLKKIGGRIRTLTRETSSLPLVRAMLRDYERKHKTAKGYRVSWTILQVLARNPG